MYVEHSIHRGEQRFRARDRSQFVEAGYAVHAGFRSKDRASDLEVGALKPRSQAFAKTLLFLK